MLINNSHSVCSLSPKLDTHAQIGIHFQSVLIGGIALVSTYIVFALRHVRHLPSTRMPRKNKREKMGGWPFLSPECLEQQPLFGPVR